MQQHVYQSKPAWAATFHQKTLSKQMNLAFASTLNNTVLFHVDHDWVEAVNHHRPLRADPLRLRELWTLRSQAFSLDSCRQLHLHCVPAWQQYKYLDWVRQCYIYRLASHPPLHAQHNDSAPETTRTHVQFFPAPLHQCDNCPCSPYCSWCRF